MGFGIGIGIGIGICCVLVENPRVVFLPFLIDDTGVVLVVIVSEVVQMILHVKNFVRNLGKCLGQPRFEILKISEAAWR